MTLSIEEKIIDLGIAKGFLNKLDPNTSNFTFQTFDDNKDRKDPKLIRILNGTLEEHATALINLNAKGAGVFITVNQTDGTGRKKENIMGIRALWVEDDNGNAPAIPIEPHMKIESSPGKYHSYILVTGAILDEFEPVQQRLVDDYGSDPNAKDRSRVLRLPGFYHQKGDPHLVNILNSNQIPPYDWSEIKGHFNPVIKTIKPIFKQSVTIKTDMSEVKAALEQLDPNMNRDEWILVGMALHSTNDSAAFELWDSWSSPGKTYSLEDIQLAWNSFKTKADGTAIGTLFWMASEKKAEHVTNEITTLINNGSTNLGNIIPKIGDANLSSTNNDKLVDLLVQRGLGSKRSIKNDLNNYISNHSQLMPTADNEILYAESKLPQIVDYISKQLAGMPKPIVFNRGGDICEVVEYPTVTVDGITKDEKNYAISLIGDIRFVDILTRNFSFKKQQLKKTTAIGCPMLVSKTLINRRGKSSLPPLAAIIHTPTLRSDGSILNKAGYDQATGLYLTNDEYEDIKIPDELTKKDALKAYEVLFKPFEKFPFVSGVDKSVIIACLLTALLRPTLRSAPLFLLSATKMGTGKSLLANIITMITSGRSNPSMMSYSDNDDEMQKRFLSILRAGSNIVCIDNVSTAIKSDNLCSILTEPEFSGRVLGLSTIITLPTTTTWIATGNSLRVAGDLSTRSLLCRLDAHVERPEERVFSTNLYKWVPAHRKELITAALTLLHAYQVSNKKRCNVKPWGRFEEWSECVRKPLIWLGKADPYESTKEIQTHDPVRDELYDLLEWWHEKYGNKPMLLRDVINDITNYTSDPKHPSEFSNYNKDIFQSPRHLGGYLRKHKGRIEGGYVIDEYGSRRNTALWSVEKLKVHG